MRYFIIMKITFNGQKLEKLMVAFYNCTGVSISIFNSDYVCVANAGSPQQFCNLVRKNPLLLSNCTLSDEQHFLEAKEQKRTISYTCHAGIVETVTPIFYENVIIAYIIIGRFRDAEKTLSSKKMVRQAFKKHGMNPSEYLELYKLLPILSQKQLDSAIFILKSCIRYIWSEHLIELNKNMLPAKIENYIIENIASELTVEKICKLFYISKETLYSVFRDEFNDTVKNFINNKRLQLAETLLKDTETSVSSIAEKIGFPDYNYFIRLFKSKMGITPLQYRKSVIKNGDGNAVKGTPKTTTPPL